MPYPYQLQWQKIFLKQNRLLRQRIIATIKQTIYKTLNLHFKINIHKRSQIIFHNTHNKFDELSLIDKKHNDKIQMYINYTNESNHYISISRFFTLHVACHLIQHLFRILKPLDKLFVFTLHYFGKRILTFLLVFICIENLLC